MVAWLAEERIDVDGIWILLTGMVVLLIAMLVYGYWQGSRAVMHYRGEVDLSLPEARDVVQQSLRGHNRFANVDTNDTMVRRSISKAIKVGPLSGREVDAYVVVMLKSTGANTTMIDLETTWEGNTFFGVMPVTLNPVTAARRAGRRTLSNLSLDRKAVIETA